MRPTAALLRVALCLSSAAPLVSAWPGWLPDIDALVVRANADSKEGNTALPTGATGGGGEGANTAEPTQPPNSKQTQTSGSNDSKTGDNKGSKTDSKNDHKTTSKKKGPTHTTFDPESPPGNVVLQTPGVFAAGAPLYRIGDYVTWGWNYTNLLGTPTAIDVLIGCSAVSETWTLTSNMTFKTSVAYTWNSSVQATDVSQPLSNNMYTLIVKDSDSAVTQIPDPGYLGTFSSYTFGLYTSQPYVDYDKWTCDACNAALAKFDHHVLGFAITMGMVTVLSFTWFVSGVDLA
ncbi:uncharacterized protein TrAFT101_011259 [Trichoderma asperellum]|uniref:DUF7137 domain-containing protein n=1 Tax=Trichoderma asperellum (strain ATCC 204424 / CBS 433.97 / NBRC 101777) TaxID=1042311 RepID=A0A2T3YS33_TRIA4|nr:hypothetical protein M441DRAFT_74332 [Trichoderma asperellum CBS 433.97]PTB35383.1 hypothetical protein M441DRAFT_74332 [Trichoderma asperellum CBS 433.97]UKZ96470.1 hypothetical protein TrAFT101_011259 [Trichoderma asperellum]